MSKLEKNYPRFTVQYCTNKVATSSASVGCIKKKMKHVKKSSVVHYVKNVASLKMHQRADQKGTAWGEILYCIAKN